MGSQDCRWETLDTDRANGCIRDIEHAYTKDGGMAVLFDHQDEIRAYIRQCWAEAKVLYDRGEIPPYADRRLIEDIRQMQDEATEDDYRVGLIAMYLEAKEKTCILDIWKNALHNEYTKPTKKDSNEISVILQSVPGWKKLDKTKHFREYGTQKCWVKEDSEQDEIKIEDYIDDLPM